MLTFIVKRLVSGLSLLLAVSLIAFLLLYSGGGDIARRLMGDNATDEIVARRAEELGLDRPIIVQFWDWLTSALTGDLGRSWFTGQLVAAGLSSRLSVTLSLVIGVTLVSAVLAVLLGVLAARRGGWVDTTVQVFSVIGFAVPGFLVAIALISVFAIQLGWFRATGFTPITTEFTGWLSSVTLPIAALSVGAIASVAQQVRGGVLDAVSRDYVRTLRSRGLKMNRVVYKHVLRNAGGPALAVLGLQFIGLVGGAVIVEQVFALPGIGQLAVQATGVSDVPVVMGVVILITIIVVVVNLIIDLAQAFLNPKVRLS